jgi:ParB family chromosome partitioning protein
MTENLNLLILPAGELTPNPRNPRGPVTAEDAGMDELIASVREKGVLQPPVITSDRTIVIGHRRHRAAEICGVSLPCLIKDYDVIEQQEIMLIENLQRQDLDPLREGQAYARLVAAGLNYNDIARRVGMPHIRVSQRLDITRLPPDIGKLFATLDLPVSAASVLVKIEDEDALRRIVGMVVSRRLAVPAIEKLVKETLRPKKPIRNYRPSRHPGRPRGIVRDDLVAALTPRASESVSLGDLVRELDYVCCACGMNATEESRATLCSACPLAAFLNRFVQIPLPDGAHPLDLMAKTAKTASEKAA